MLSKLKLLQECTAKHVFFSLSTLILSKWVPFDTSKPDFELDSSQECWKMCFCLLSHTQSLFYTNLKIQSKQWGKAGLWFEWFWRSKTSQAGSPLLVASGGLMGWYNLLYGWIWYSSEVDCGDKGNDKDDRYTWFSGRVWGWYLRRRKGFLDNCVLLTGNLEAKRFIWWNLDIFPGWDLSAWNFLIPFLFCKCTRNTPVTAYDPQFSINTWTICGMKLCSNCIPWSFQPRTLWQRKWQNESPYPHHQALDFYQQLGNVDKEDEYTVGW